MMLKRLEHALMYIYHNICLVLYFNSLYYNQNIYSLAMTWFKVMNYK